ncbi:MAG: ATP-binding cassette domain-containing protein [Sphaerochaetaceae bacterium]
MPKVPMIALENISVQRAGRPILNNVSLTVDAGEHTAIIGSNGAGKSTLVQVISQEVHPLWKEDSKCLLFGKERWRVLELREKMGIVSQSLQYMCNSSYKVHHIVLSAFFSSIGLDFHHQVSEEMIERAAESLQKLGVAHLKEKPMHTLSSGEARRVLLSRAVVHNPAVMLLDEAVSNLDLPAKRDYRQALKSFTQEGKTLILVTHDLSEIIEEIERVVLLKEGEVLAEGAKEEVLTEELLSEAYNTKVFLTFREGRFNAWC